MKDVIIIIILQFVFHPCFVQYSVARWTYLTCRHAWKPQGECVAVEKKNLRYNSEGPTLYNIDFTNFFLTMCVSILLMNLQKWEKFILYTLLHFSKSVH